MTKHKAYLYLRFSSSDQAKGDSYRRQFENAKAYCLKYDLDLQDTKFEDLGISAFKGKNAIKGAFGKLLLAINNDEIKKGDFVIVESLDRISRQSPLKALPDFIQLLSSGINVVTLIDGVTHNHDDLEKNPYNLIISLSTMIRAHEESNVKAKRVSQAWKNKYDKAVEFKTPLSKLCPSWIDLKKDSYVLNKKKVKVIKKIFKSYISGHGQNKIASMLNESNTPTLVTSHGRKAKQWHKSTIGKLLSNNALIGVHTPTNGRDPINDFYPPALDVSTFSQAQQLRKVKGHTSGGRKGTSFANLLQGCCTCKSCGNSMRYINKNADTKWQYLVCSGAVDKTTHCKRLSYNYHDLELVVLLTISNLKIEKFERNIKPVNEDLERKLNVLNEKADNIQGQYERAVELHITKGDGQGNKILEKVDKLSEQIDKIKLDINLIEDEIAKNLSHDTALPILLSLHNSKDVDSRANFNQHLRKLMTFTFGNKIQEVKCMVDDEIVEILVPDETQGLWKPTLLDKWNSPISAT